LNHATAPVSVRKIWHWLVVHPSMDIVLILSAGLAVGVSLARDYGLSWDEYTNQVYARDTIGAYLGVRSPDDTLMDLKYYGPAFNVAWLIARNLIARLVPNLRPTDAGHFIYFLSFLAGVIFFYSLARRIAGRGAGVTAVLIFVTQPAVLGHAFVNPKDIPFMTSSWRPCGLASAQEIRWPAARRCPL